MVVAAVARLRVVLGLYRVDVYKVAAMALGLKVPSKVPFGKVGTVAAALVAIKTPPLLVTLVTVISCLAGQDAVTAHEIGIMVDCNALALMAIIALLDGHGSVFLMRHLLCIRLLLEIHQDASQKRNYENNLFH
jgi:hypothetical protein